MIGVALTSVVDDPVLTSFGRLAEVYSAMERRLAGCLESECGIAHSWFEVLLRLARSDSGQLTMGDLAAQVALTTGGVTRLADRMVAAGLVERLPCPSDRRIAYIGLTAAGRAKVEEAAVVAARELRAAFLDLEDEQVHTFDIILDQLRGAPRK